MIGIFDFGVGFFFEVVDEGYLLVVEQYGVVGDVVQIDDMWDMSGFCDYLINICFVVFVSVQDKWFV